MRWITLSRGAVWRDEGSEVWRGEGGEGLIRFGLLLIATISVTPKSSFLFL